MSLASIAYHLYLFSIESQQPLAQGSLLSVCQKVDKVPGTLQDVGSISVRKEAETQRHHIGATGAGPTRKTVRQVDRQCGKRRQRNKNPLS